MDGVYGWRIAGYIMANMAELVAVHQKLNISIKFTFRLCPVDDGFACSDWLTRYAFIEVEY